MADSDAVELTDADAQSKALRDPLLQLLATESWLSLTLLDEKGENLSTDLGGMTMASIGKGGFPLISNAFEQSIDRCAMHGNGTLQPGLFDGGSLLNLFDDLALGCGKGL